MEAPLIDGRAEIKRALETIGFAATARQIWSACPGFADEGELRRELHAMSKADELRVVSETSPARYALPGGAPPMPEVLPARKPSADDDGAPVQRRRVATAVDVIVPPRPQQPPKEEPSMPKKTTRLQTSLIVLEALKASRDPMVLGEIAKATDLTIKKVSSTLNVLRNRGEVHVAGYLDGNKKKSQWAPGGKGSKRKAAKTQPGAAVPVPGGGSDMRIWLANSGAMRLEKGDKALDLTLADAQELQAFMLDLSRITPGGAR